MKGYYASYKCKSCKNELILISDEVDAATNLEGKYLTCPYCGSKRLIHEGLYDDLNECMNERSYFRSRSGAIRQR